MHKDLYLNNQETGIRGNPICTTCLFLWYIIKILTYHVDSDELLSLCYTNLPVMVIQIATVPFNIVRVGCASLHCSTKTHCEITADFCENSKKLANCSALYLGDSSFKYIQRHKLV